MDLNITTTTDADSRTVLSLKGSLDLQSRGTLIEAAKDPGATSGLVLDLAEVDFMDSTGIGAIVQLAGDCDDAERPFALRNPSPRVNRILEVTGLLDSWPIETTA